VEKPLFEKYDLEQPPVYLNETKEIYIQENVALEEAIEKVENTVIGVKAITTKRKIIEGSGLIVTSDGLVVTLAELIPQGSTFYFYIDGLPASYQILKRDSKENLALVKIDKNNLSTGGFADIEKIKLGRRVFMVGNIFATTTPEKIINEGIVQNFNSNLIKTNIMQENGAKGSVLFDIEGNVLGINYLDALGGIVSIPITRIKIFAGL
jgi:S1-C subfamily serine protease